MLWVGWFGFNAGSALSAGTLATSAFVTTQLAAAAGALSWIAAEWWRQGKPSALGAVSGAIAGLATITPAAGYVGPMAALAIGTLTGVVCYLMVVVVKAKFGYDDSLDAFGIHGVGGMLGTVLTGVFASSLINPAFHGGHLHQVLNQLVAVAIGVALAAGGTIAILKFVDITIGLRVSEEHEALGLDLSQHGEEGYYWEVPA
jgi:Amt family ammonium transporter